MTLAFNFNIAEINWLAVLVAAFATFLLGGLWYTALFGKVWQRLNGYTDDQLKQMRVKRPPPVFFGIMIGAYVVIAVFFGVLVTSFNLTGAGDGAILGLIIWFIVAAVGATGQAASDKPMIAFSVDALYQLVYLVMTGAIIAGWR
jgi:hypothetical protein